MASDESLSKRESRLFFSAFFLIGSLVFVIFFVTPVLRVLGAMGWRETSCTIISSQVKTHSGSSSDPTYSIDIRFSYHVDGKEYHSNRYNFKVGVSSSGYSGKATVVGRYPPGKTTTCYVNPGNVKEAVINRGLPGDLWVGIVPLIFMLIGAGGLFRWKSPAFVREMAIKAHQQQKTSRYFKRPHPKVIVAAKPKWPHLLSIIVSVLVLTIWYVLVLDLSNIASFDLQGIIEHIQTLVSNSPFILVFLLLPLLNTPQIIKSLKIVMVNDTLTFDGLQKTILKGKHQLAHFDEVEHLHVKAIMRKKIRVYTLNGVLKNGQQIDIDESKYFDRICEIADEIATVIDVPVVKTDLF